MAWDYADLSKAAKNAGGPEALTDLLVQSGRNQMVPWMIGIGGLGIGVGVVITKAKQFIKTRKELSQQVVEAAEQEVIQGIKQYDAEHENNQELKQDKI